MLPAEVEGRLVAYRRVPWVELAEGSRLYRAAFDLCARHVSAEPALGPTKNRSLAKRGSGFRLGTLSGIPDKVLGSRYEPRTLGLLVRIERIVAGLGFEPRTSGL